MRTRLSAAALFTRKISLCFAILGHAFALFQFLSARARIPAPDLWTGQFLFFAGLSLALSVLLALAIDVRAIHVLFLFQLIVFVLIGVPEGDYLDVEFTLLQVLILQTVLRLGFRGGLPVSLGLIVLASALQMPLSAWGRAIPGVPVYNIAGLVFYSLLTTTLGLSLRRSVAESEENGARNRSLERAVSSLATANLGFQEYAVTAEEVSVNRERKRVSRDIHDTTGYTLVNIIMMLEDAMDLAGDRSEKLSALLAKSRDLAKTGLQETRKALRVIREMEEEGPVGLHAIQRMARVFEESTGVTVNVEFGNLPWTMGERIDQFLYRMVQEGMTNAFRHGKARRILLRFWIHGGELLASVEDDGSGNPQFEKGIGLSGMEERVAQLGGMLRFGSLPDGFELAATIPLEEDHG